MHSFFVSAFSSFSRFAGLPFSPFSLAPPRSGGHDDSLGAPRPHAGHTRIHGCPRHDRCLSVELDGTEHADRYASEGSHAADGPSPTHPGLFTPDTPDKVLPRLFWDTTWLYFSLGNGRMKMKDKNLFLAPSNLLRSSRIARVERSCTLWATRSTPRPRSRSRTTP